MVKDFHLRLLFIPVLGICLPLLSGIISYERHSLLYIVLANLCFILVSFIIWTGSNWMHRKVRFLYTPVAHPFSRITHVCLTQALYGICIGCMASLGWYAVSGEPFSWNNQLKFVILCALAVILFTLLYEILFLTRERELDSIMVEKLGKERSRAELKALFNELNPHFIFNSLNTLSYLIRHNADQAHRFNNKLAQVYKYFLLNRERDVIPLSQELEFINDYFYLLQIRHDHKLHLHHEPGDEYNGVLIPPCALQILVENAIKHNSFTEENPLQISIRMNGQFLKISNNINSKPYSVNSTRVGLRNLRARYQLICKKDIVVESLPDNYTVKLPLIR